MNYDYIFLPTHELNYKTMFLSTHESRHYVFILFFSNSWITAVCFFYEPMNYDTIFLPTHEIWQYIFTDPWIKTIYFYRLMN